ncbi:hypothetical protein [Fulvivirga sedimenti]|uniref:Uncharacterized protein n=1 Tax=Fulvivirga sedimenti TaxID=2879465 RepID=A0A9X1HWJ5_9BACT|nr:hypothetical protein [Fulvivirga sedimenti]MCA6078368.1 hypothetical protein [Fulvivirga sedimenti]
MNNPFEELQSSWNKSRQEINTDQQKIDLLISSARSKQKSNLYFYYGNIAILAVTVLVLIVVWQLWMPFREQLSKIGIGVMIGSLVLRIIVEVFSTLKSRKINLLDTAVDSNEERISYYQFRKAVHGPVTITLITTYLIGLLMIMPELNMYISTSLLVIFMAAFILSGLFIIYKVRQSIKQEMENLQFFMTIEQELKG